MSPELEARVRRESALAEALWERLVQETAKLGLGVGEPQFQGLERLHYRLETDPASGEAALIGDWRDGHGHRIGGLILHADGSFFGEYDVIRTHPGNPRLFVEAVTVWGRDADIKSEPRLLPMVS